MANSVPHHQVSTTNEIPGCRIVRSRSVVGNLGAALQTIVGGNITIYTEAVREGARGGVRADAAARRRDGRERRGGDALRRQRGGPGRHRGAGLRHGGAGGGANMKVSFVVE